MLLSKMLVREEISSQLPTSERPRRCSSETLEDKNLFDEMYHLKVTKTREISWNAPNSGNISWHQSSSIVLLNLLTHLQWQQINSFKFDLLATRRFASWPLVPVLFLAVHCVPICSRQRTRNTNLIVLPWKIASSKKIYQHRPQNPKNLPL